MDNCSIGCFIILIGIILICLFTVPTQVDGFVVDKPWPLRGAPASPIESPDLSTYPHQLEAIRPSTVQNQDTCGKQNSEIHDPPLAYKDVSPVGHPYRRAEKIGYRWTESWRPYVWKNYPEPPIWFPARSPSADEGEMPRDPKILAMMEASQKCSGNSKCDGLSLEKRGISPQGYKYFWRLDQPYQPLCADFADKACRDQPTPHFCYRRTMAKCLNGVL